MKKLFALLLAVIMVISMVACAPAAPADTTAGKADATTAAKETTAATTTEAKPSPWTDPKCFDLTGIVEDNTITIGLTVDSTVITYADNKLTKYMEEITGLNVEFIFFANTGDEARQQLALMMANQEKLPDVIYGFVNDELQSEYGAQGLLCDVTEFLKKSPRLAQYLEAMTDFERDYFWARLEDGITGEIYAVPKFYLNDGVDSNEWIVSISSTMAKNVGMDAAEIDTIDELYEYLTKTVHGDGNGNGKKDELGLIFRQNGYRSNAEEWIINAYVYCMDYYLFNVTDGEVWMPYGTDEYRQAMITMNKWCKEGLIEEMSYGLTYDDMVALVREHEDDPANYKLTAWGAHPTQMVKSDSDIGLDYTFANTLTDETGKGGYANIQDPYVLQKGAVIFKNEEEPERMELAYLFCDIQFDWEVHQHWRYGEQGENWGYIDGEAMGLKDKNGNWAGFAVIDDPWAVQTNVVYHIDSVASGATNAIAMGLQPGGVPMDTSTWASTGDRNLISYGNLWEKREHDVPDEVLYNLCMNAEEQEVWNEYKSLFDSYMKQARAKFVTGILDPNDDAVWEQYLKELNLNGHDALVEIAQSSYDRMTGKIS